MKTPHCHPWHRRQSSAGILNRSALRRRQATRIGRVTLDISDTIKDMKIALFGATGNAGSRIFRPVRLATGLALASLSAMVGCAVHNSSSMITLAPATMPRIATVDERYQSYNVEMLEVTGGKFWKPYAAKPTAMPKPNATGGAAVAAVTPSGMNPDMYEYRPPIDLTNGRRIKLAAALSPAYVRVSGTWANTSYFPESDDAPQSPPAGFDGVLSRQQWKGVVDFAHAAKAEIVTSFAISPGTRDANGVWISAQARRFLDYTRLAGGNIAAAEFMNEPTFAKMGGAPVGYDAADYGRDFKVFLPFAKQAAPNMLILGPGSVGETVGDWGMATKTMALLNTRDLLAASDPGVDAFSYHHYGAASERAANTGMPMTSVGEGLSEEWLARTDQTLEFYKHLRDEFEPGKPIWVTETADAACGGNPWASTFLDTFRYLDQLGRLAKCGVTVVIHNTLDASDYGLLDEKTLTPRPNYWAALLWRKLMGTTVFESGVPIREGLHLYAHSLRGHPGGVALLAINNSRTQSTTIDLPLESERFTLTTRKLEDRHVQLNGQELKLGANDELPSLSGKRIPAGHIELPPASITFLAVPSARNGK
jgi:heparanase